MMSSLEKKLFDLLNLSLKEGKISKKYHQILLEFYICYKNAALSAGSEETIYAPLFTTLAKLVIEQSATPYSFSHYHKKIRKPFDYYRFGLDLFRPIVDLDHSTLLGKESLDAISSFLKKGENVVFFANHQVEPDPQVMSLLLEKKYPKLAEEIIFVAGERVLIDPLAIPMSMGRNLLCIFSKKHIDHPPELKLQKQLHNKRTMQIMSDLLSEGGKAIYVAPSGGRDRPDEKGEIKVAPFDPNSIEMFYLMAKKAKKTTHFFPLALLTYDILPPPDKREREMGERRITTHTPIHMAVGKEIDMDLFPGNDATNKELKRKNRSDYIHSLVVSSYKKLCSKK
jgi:glycerol-3-phosphate O-acyltransferase